MDTIICERCEQVISGALIEDHMREHEAEDGEREREEAFDEAIRRLDGALARAMRRDSEIEAAYTRACRRGDVVAARELANQYADARFALIETQRAITFMEARR